MKKLINTIAFFLIYISINAQPIPPSGYNHGGGGAQVPGGGAPIGDGIYILLFIGLIWGVWKYYLIKKLINLEHKIN